MFYNMIYKYTESIVFIAILNTLTICRNKILNLKYFLFGLYKTIYRLLTSLLQCCIIIGIAKKQEFNKPGIPLFPTSVLVPLLSYKCLSSTFVLQVSRSSTFVLQVSRSSTFGSCPHFFVRFITNFVINFKLFIIIIIIIYFY